ncbi:hypothetical protein JTE90_003757 [Oedothorax gibbosus]|uniref:Fucosyltransferase n=1 Tax=Oedothorax gibbosus TaxID=931172 RepID=A0AAV6VD10_9ARAC|nr:hypothetical protein JTE90_003757 [Oedothorax gibbosus]
MLEKRSTSETSWSDRLRPKHGHVMRQFRLPRPQSVLVVTCCLFVFLNALFRVGFKIETRILRPRLPPPDTPTDAPTLRADRPWYMRRGAIRPEEPRPGEPAPELWPHESGGDRITNQLMYNPGHHNATLKSILVWNGHKGWGDVQLGRAVFLRDSCPVDACEITVDKRRGKDAHLVLFKDRFTPPVPYVRPPQQIWLLFLLECPLHTMSFKSAAGYINWTASYRRDSDIVAPYEKWVPYTPATPPKSRRRRKKKRGSGRVAWFVSNCGARNKRMQYAKELSRHYPVDLFGKCGGGRRCPRSSACFRMLSRDYKFYLAFENSNCKDYITEKFFVNGLGNDVLPIVMGARPEDYARSAPDHSYLHVEDYSSPAHLAEYLHELDSNDTLYNEYFDWQGRGEFINTRFWCRLCALMHAPVVPKVYTDIDTWWAGKGTCTPDEWRSHAQPSQDTPIE